MLQSFVHALPSQKQKQTLLLVNLNQFVTQVAYTLNFGLFRNLGNFRRRNNGQDGCLRHWKLWIFCDQMWRMPPINFFSINENSAVQHVLEIPKVAGMKLGQLYTNENFDLAFSKKSKSIVWQNPEKLAMWLSEWVCFIRYVLLNWAFRGKMKGRELSDILNKSGICASGSLDKSMTGKYFNLALRVCEFMEEALERLLMWKFKDENKLETLLPKEVNELF